VNATRFAASLRTGNSPQRKEAQPLSHARTTSAQLTRLARRLAQAEQRRAAKSAKLTGAKEALKKSAKLTGAKEALKKSAKLTGAKEALKSAKLTGAKEALKSAKLTGAKAASAGQAAEVAGAAEVAEAQRRRRVEADADGAGSFQRRPAAARLEAWVQVSVQSSA
jgi:hypothetical protein